MRQTATQFQMPGMANALSISSRRSFDTEPWAAFYCRLSQDDGLDGESNSIQHQKQILERYAKDHGITRYKFYVDDGISGTTFNRPGFQEMLADIEAGYVYMVVVKDMSRFGRDYLQVGMYTEVLFPEKDIHFVAINDGVDSEKGDNDFTPLRNLFNEWYARDTSKKIRAVVKAKGMSGKRLSHLPPYGYIMGEDDNWVIDEETGPVVKEIFALCLSGLGPTKIANILTTRNIPTPGTVNYRRYGNKQGYCTQAPCKWLYQTVSNILERVEYLGHTVNFKTTKKSYKSKKVIINGDDKRMIFKDTHPALIDQDTFDRVQVIRQGKCRHTKIGTVGLFSGLLFCADCGSKMYHHRGSGLKESYEYYTCAGYSKRVNPCTSQIVRKNLDKQRITMGDESVLVLATVQLLRNWSTDTAEESSGQTFWNYIYLQFGFNPQKSGNASQRLYQRFRLAVVHTLQRFRRFLAPEATTQRYYTSLMLHAMAPVQSLESLFNILFDFYGKNLGFHYVAEDVSYKTFTQGMQSRWNPSVHEEMLHLRSDIVSSGLKVLFQERPGYMTALCENLVKKMDALLRDSENELDPDRDYWDYLLLVWYRKKSAVERAQVQSEYSAPNRPAKRRK